MKKVLKNKPVVLVVAVVALLIVGLFIFILGNKSADQNNDNLNVVPTEIPIPVMSAEELGLTLKYGKEGKSVIITVTKIEGIKSIESRITYTSEGNIPRGFTGKLDLTKTPVTKEFDLGTCSDTCHYDKGVIDIKAILKITKDDDKVYQAEQTLAPME